MGSENPHKARVQATTTNVRRRWAPNAVKPLPPSKQAHLRTANYIWEVLERTISGLKCNLLIVIPWLPLPRVWSNTLQLQVRPHTRRIRLRPETIMTWNSPSWNGLVQVVRNSLSTTTQARRTRLPAAVGRSLWSSVIPIAVPSIVLLGLPETHPLWGMVRMGQQPPLAMEVSTLMSIMDMLQVIALRPGRAHRSWR